jgi:hypothetical protein
MATHEQPARRRGHIEHSEIQQELAHGFQFRRREPNESDVVRGDNAHAWFLLHR